MAKNFCIYCGSPLTPGVECACREAAVEPAYEESTPVCVEPVSAPAEESYPKFCTRCGKPLAPGEICNCPPLTAKVPTCEIPNTGAVVGEIETTMETKPESVTTSGETTASEVAPTPAMAYAPVADNVAPYAPPRKKQTGLIVTIIILSLVILGIVGFGAYYFLSESAVEEEISSEQVMYDEALSLLEDGEFEEAKKKFEDLGSYSDSENMVKECDFKFAENKTDNRKYLEAYELYESLDDYKESETKKNNLKKDVYSEGIEYYQLEKYDEAMERFEKIEGYKRSSDYQLLIDAHNDDIYNVNVLYDILDLEDAKDIIINNDEYALSFLKGYWEAYDGSYIRFYTEGGGNTCAYSIPAPEGSRWEISDGIHYIVEGSIKSKAWDYTIVDRDTITIYNYSTGSTVTMYRQ